MAATREELQASIDALVAQSQDLNVQSDVILAQRVAIKQQVDALELQKQQTIATAGAAAQVDAVVEGQTLVMDVPK